MVIYSDKRNVIHILFFSIEVYIFFVKTDIQADGRLRKSLNVYLLGTYFRFGPKNTILMLNNVVFKQLL